MYERRNCNTKLARELNRVYSIPRNDIPLVSAITSAMAMPAANNSHGSETQLPDPDDCNTQALKTGRFKSTHKQLHKVLGHFGHLPECIICMQGKKNLNRIYKNPHPKEDNRVAEYVVQRIEITTKRSMAMTSSPAQHYCHHADHCVKVLARLPLTRNISTADCDAVRPPEQLFNYDGQTEISRAQCDKDLLAINVPGSLALCTDKDTKGSDLDQIDRCAWGIFLGTKGMNQVDMGHLFIIENPFTKTHRHTKSMTDLQLTPYQNAHENAWSTLGLPTPLVTANK